MSTIPTCLKIAACGAHGTGKSTFMNKLETALLEAKNSNKIARSANITRNIINTLPAFFSKKGASALASLDIAAAQQLSILCLQLQSYYSSPNTGILLSDRGFVDIWAYAKLFEQTYNKNSQLIKVFYETYDQAINKDQPIWDYLVFFPIRSTMEIDGTRPTDINIQMQTQNFILEQLRLHSPNFSLALRSNPNLLTSEGKTHVLTFDCNKIANKLFVLNGEPNWSEEVSNTVDSLKETLLAPSLYF